MKIGRNDPCPCGSGKKYKKCCLRKNEIDNQTQRVDISTELASNFEHIKNKQRDKLSASNIYDISFICSLIPDYVSTLEETPV